MSYFYNEQKREIYVGRIITTIAATICAGVVAVAAGCPSYNVYNQMKAGEAELAQANYSKQVAVQTAIAKNESAKYEAEAEITRAQGVAKANQIIGDSLKNNEAYLRYLFVNNLADTKDQVIYIPTEANLPILEANRGVNKTQTSTDVNK